MIDSAGVQTTLPLLPLQGVLFPGGQLSVKVFEPRFLDLASRSLREQAPLGIVCRAPSSRTHTTANTDQADQAEEFEAVGVVAQALAADSAQPGILQLRCRGSRRFRTASLHRQADGLWAAEVNLLADDPSQLPSPAMFNTVQGLARAIASLQEQGTLPFVPPYQFDDAGWVANRWCEILPIPTLAKQRLMELEDPAMRLQLVHEYLRGKGVV